MWTDRQFGWAALMLLTSAIFGNLMTSWLSTSTHLVWNWNPAILLIHYWSNSAILLIHTKKGEDRQLDPRDTRCDGVQRSIDRGNRKKSNLEIFSSKFCGRASPHWRSHITPNWDWLVKKSRSNNNKKLFWTGTS